MVNSRLYNNNPYLSLLFCKKSPCQLYTYNGIHQVTSTRKQLKHKELNYVQSEYKYNTNTTSAVKVKPLKTQSTVLNRSTNYNQLSSSIIMQLKLTRSSASDELVKTEGAELKREKMPTVYWLKSQILQSQHDSLRVMSPHQGRVARPSKDHLP